jgi:PAS domain S-box-containing protein
MDPKGFITFFNIFAQDFFDYSEDEILGRNVIGTIVPETDAAGHNLTAMIENIGKHPERYIKNENENIRRNGERVWIAWTNKAFLDDQGRIVEILSIGNDITDHKQMDETLRQSEEKYRTLIENIQDGVFVIQDRKLKFVNEAFAVADRYARMMAGEDVPMEYEFHALQKDGVTRTIVHMTVGLINYQGRPAALGTVKDITERKQMERALAAEKERLAVTLSSIGDGVIATNAEGKVTLLNKVAENLTGWSQEKAVGKPFNEVFCTINEDSRRPCENPVEKVIKIGIFFNIAGNTVLIARDGTEKAIADSAAPILDKHSKIVGVVLVFRDITEKRKIEQELQKTAKLESVGILAGGIAHDFNNILTAILGNISLANIYAKSENKISNKLKDAEKACLRAKDLTQQLLTFSKGGEPVKKPISIAMLVKESATLSLSGSNSRCKFFIPSDLWLIEADEGQISQVINNLLINADQAMPEGGIIEIHCENIVIEENGHLPLKQGNYVKILIKDHGIGISKDHLPRIFDPYFTTKHKGSGLGLATVYSIIKRHGGYIEIESEKGIGTIFHIYLPATEKRQNILQKETAKVARGAGKILLMDDEKIILEIMDKMLRELGYEVEFARDGNEAIDLYRKAQVSGHPFASVIMDLTIPDGMGGKEAIQKLREMDPDVKAIVSSGYSTDPVMSNFRKYGFCGVLTKPFKIKELGETLKETMSC